MMMGLWFILLVPFVILMVVVGNRRRNEEEDEEVGSGTYHGEDEEEEEEEEEGEDERESRKKTKEDPTPLWKYVTRQARTRGGGTTKFVCPHCNKTYTGSYTRVRRHLCGHMPCDERKTIGAHFRDKHGHLFL